jgi:hypothetical protein
MMSFDLLSFQMQYLGLIDKLWFTERHIPFVL